MKLPHFSISLVVWKPENDFQFQCETRDDGIKFREFHEKGSNAYTKFCHIVIHERIDYDGWAQNHSIWMMKNIENGIFVENSLEIRNSNWQIPEANIFALLHLRQLQQIIQKMDEKKYYLAKITWASDDTPWFITIRCVIK